MRILTLFFVFCLSMVACTSETPPEEYSCDHGGPEGNLPEPLIMDDGLVITGLWANGTIDGVDISDLDSFKIDYSSRLFAKKQIGNQVFNFYQLLPFSLSGEMETCSFFSSVHYPDSTGTLDFGSFRYQASTNYYDLVDTGQESRYFTSLLDFQETGYLEIQLKYKPAL